MASNEYVELTLYLCDALWVDLIKWHKFKHLGITCYNAACAKKRIWQMYL